MIELHTPRRYSIPDTAEPGWAELCDALDDILLDRSPGDPAVELERLKSRVYRLRAGSNGRVHSFVLKRYDPWLARRNELVVQRWLPALRLGATRSHARGTSSRATAVLMNSASTGRTARCSAAVKGAFFGWV